MSSWSSLIAAALAQSKPEFKKGARTYIKSVRVDRAQMHK